MSVKNTYDCDWETKGKSYIEQKVDVLEEFGITNRVALKNYLEEKTANAATESKREIQIDNICRDIINAYFEGDRTFCVGFN